ncbi:MAG: class I SAM-dependent methyltransferase [Thiobacillus sp.]|nr:class I SAM-dependent methyltransferase [Thiobacillus sp.]
MQPDDYDAWYDTPRGRWIGETEYALAARGLAAQPGERLLDVGCGTGWFTRRAAADDLVATGLDPNADWLAYARVHSSPALNWVEGDARDLPFSDASFDHVLSIAALCFVDDERRAVAEAIRVARRRFALGWLNRASLLYWQKGRHGGSGAYRGARWHSAREVREMFAGLPVKNLKLRSAIFLPSGSGRATWLERGVPKTLPWGGMLLVSGEKT